MNEPDRRAEPMFNVPPVVVVVLGLLIAVHVVRQWLPPETDDWLVGALGFIPMRYDSVIDQWPGGLASAIASPVTHVFVHGDIVHLGINGAMLLAFGGLVARRVGAIRMLSFTAVSAAAGALLFYVANPGESATMIGASGGISGLMAAGLRLMFSAVDNVPDRYAGDVLRGRPDFIPLTPLPTALMDNRLRTATIVWLAINLLAAFGVGTPPSAGSIAWEAHVGGYLGGLLLFGAFDNGARQDRTPVGSSPGEQS